MFRGPANRLHPSPAGLHQSRQPAAGPAQRRSPSRALGTREHPGLPSPGLSDSLASAGWGETTIAKGNLAEAVTRLKHERPDGYLLAHGGVRFARSLVETGLIDEYRLVVHPVVLGAGERLFGAPLTIEPVSTTVFSGGAVAHVFAAHP
jgi:hypothetical protein